MNGTTRHSIWRYTSVLDLLALCLFGGLPFTCVADSVLKLSNSLSQAPTQVGQFPWTEDDQHDHQDEKQVGRLKQTFHRQTSV